MIKKIAQKRGGTLRDPLEVVKLDRRLYFLYLYQKDGCSLTEYLQEHLALTDTIAEAEGILGLNGTAMKIMPTRKGFNKFAFLQLNNMLENCNYKIIVTMVQKRYLETLLFSGLNSKKSTPK